MSDTRLQTTLFSCRLGTISFYVNELRHLSFGFDDSQRNVYVPSLQKITNQFISNIYIIKNNFNKTLD